MINPKIKLKHSVTSYEAEKFLLLLLCLVLDSARTDKTNFTNY